MNIGNLANRLGGYLSGVAQSIHQARKSYHLVPIASLSPKEEYELYMLRLEKTLQQKPIGPNIRAAFDLQRDIASLTDRVYDDPSFFTTEQTEEMHSQLLRVYNYLKFTEYGDPAARRATFFTPQVNAARSAAESLLAIGIDCRKKCCGNSRISSN